MACQPSGGCAASTSSTSPSTTPRDDGGRGAPMSHWQYHNPVAIHFGAGVLDTLPAVLAGRRASIVTFPEAQQVGLLPRLKALVGASLVGAIDDTQTNPDV